MMHRQVWVELRRLNVRSTWGIAAAMVAVLVVGMLQTATAAESAKELWERQGWLLVTINGPLFLLVLGARAVTDGFRYGTVVTDVLVTPRRGRVVAAKLAALAIAGAVMATIGGVAAIVATGEIAIGTGEARALAGIVIAGGAWSVLGGAVGYVVRHQVGAIVGVIAWAIVVEQMVGELLGDWTPGYAARILALVSDGGSALVGAAILMAYVTVATGLGVLVMQRRDVI